MTTITTVRDLIAELQRHPLDCEVVVVESATVSRRVICVLERNARVYLDTSVDDDDKLEGFLG